MTTNFFADLHIHIGRTATGRPVKITGSNKLTLTSILEEASNRKGMDIVGIIDCHVPEVLAELKQLIREGRAEELQGGGVRFQATTLLLGTEMEILDPNCQGPIHVLCYLPTIETMTHFSQWMSNYQKNITLSSQRSYVNARELQGKVMELEGLFIPAHIFTPFKSLYGKGVKLSLTEVFDAEKIDAVELGLSSDTAMAEGVPELKGYPFLTNSDAHSLAKIGREYQILALDSPDYYQVKLAIKQKGNQKIVANYGLNPRLGKYHHEVSHRLHQLIEGQHSMKLGALLESQNDRPPYIHQVPLEYIPDLGPKRLEALIKAFGSEMKVIHSTSKKELEQYVPSPVAETIIQARLGELKFLAGGAGKYGRIQLKN